jgi:hypothetical protein
MSSIPIPATFDEAPAAAGRAVRRLRERLRRPLLVAFPILLAVIGAAWYLAGEFDVRQVARSVRRRAAVDQPRCRRVFGAGARPECRRSEPRLSRDGFRAGEVGVLQVLERSAPTSWRCLARSKCERLNVGAALGYAFFFRPVFLRGTFAPARRASDRPMATACLRLVTFFFERPLRNVPVFRSCIARLTLLAAFFP